MTNHIVLFEPQIPQNTGNIAYLRCDQFSLHIIKPMGFPIDDRKMKRAGLDYWDKLEIYFYESLEDFMSQMKGKLYLISNSRRKCILMWIYRLKETIIFYLDVKTRACLRTLCENILRKLSRIPMNDEHVRSLNVSNTVCMIVYEALRQQNFAGLDLVHTYEADKLK